MQRIRNDTLCTASQKLRQNYRGTRQGAHLRWRFGVAVKAKFQYAIQLASWFEAGSEPVADRFEAGSNLSATSFVQVRGISTRPRYLEPARRRSQTGSKPNSITLSGRRQVRSWSRTCRTPASSG